MDRPTKAPKKKKPLAFLSSVPKPAPTLSHADNEDDDDDLALFSRSKDFFPTVLQEQEEVPCEVTPSSSKTVNKKHSVDGVDHEDYDNNNVDDDDDDPIAAFTRSSKRRRISAPSAREEAWRESYEDLYGPATPPPVRKSTPTSPRPTDANSFTSSDGTVRQATPPEREEEVEEGIELVQSDLLPTPSRSNSHRLLEDGVVVLDGDDDAFEELNSNGNATPSSPMDDKSSTSTSMRKEAGPRAIIIDSDDDDDPLETTSPPEEDEFAHFIRRAAEREAAARAAAAALARPDSDDEDALTPHDTGSKRKKQEPIIIVKIFVFPRLTEAPGLKPFGVKRGLNQDLGTVLKAFVQWVRSQGVRLSDEEGEKVFLTWKGRRIYDASTGVSLGWPAGEIQAPLRTPGFTNNGVLLEAWTEEGFARYTEDQERQKLIDRGELVEEGGEEDGAAEESTAAKIKLTLKEKDADPFKTTVFGDMEVRILISAYRRQRNVPLDREIKLRYEGEWLDPQMTIDQADIEDMCTIEVYLK